MNTYSKYIQNCSTEQESHLQFLNSYYNAKQFEMSRHIEKLKYNQKILVIYNATKNRLYDLAKSIEIEDAKPYVESYLFTSRNWYLFEIDKCNRKLSRLIKLYKF